MTNPTAAMLVIGDEILSGRTQDTNTQFLASALTQAGINLCEVRIVSDDENTIVNAVRALSKGFDHVFTSGGIGPTHDDITADSMGAAFGVHVGVRDDARALLGAFYDARRIDFNAARMRMARIPDGATLIDNPVSVAPGFTLGNVHVMAGVPKVFQAMATGVIASLSGGAPLLSDSLQINLPEGEIAGPLATLAADFPNLSIGSYPFSLNGVFGANIVLRGTDATMLNTAMHQLNSLFGASK